jgi:hypothetical protein
LHHGGHALLIGARAGKKALYRKCLVHDGNDRGCVS